MISLQILMALSQDRSEWARCLCRIVFQVICLFVCFLKASLPSLCYTMEEKEMGESMGWDRDISLFLLMTKPGSAEPLPKWSLITFTSKETALKWSPEALVHPPSLSSGGLPG